MTFVSRSGRPFSLFLRCTCRYRQNGYLLDQLEPSVGGLCLQHRDLQGPANQPLRRPWLRGWGMRLPMMWLRSAVSGIGCALLAQTWHIGAGRNPYTLSNRISTLKGSTSERRPGHSPRSMSSARRNSLESSESRKSSVTHRTVSGPARVNGRPSRNLHAAETTCIVSSQ